MEEKSPTIPKILGPLKACTRTGSTTGKRRNHSTTVTLYAWTQVEKFTLCAYALCEILLDSKGLELG